MGSAHDLTMILDYPPDVIRRDGPIQTIYADKGFQGLTGERLGARVRVMRPFKRLRGGRLTRKQARHNKRIGRVRIRVEHAVRRIKQYRRMAGPYNGPLSEYSTELGIVAWLVNSRMRRKGRPAA